MEILGKLGIDIKLLIAQIINFGLLLWILKKFLYAPIIRRIEEDERKLEEAKIQREKLEKERTLFLEQKTRELADARKKAEEILQEAHKLAEKIAEQAKNKAEEEKRMALRQLEAHLETFEDAVKAQLKQSARKETIRRLQRYFLSLPESVQKELQGFFWQELLKQVEKAELTHFKTPKIASALRGLRKTRKDQIAESEFEKDVAQALTEKLGPIVLEYVHPIENNRLTDLKSLLSKKIGAKIVLARKLNKDLISGFRLEVAGLIIESNLLAQINNATTSAN